MALIDGQLIREYVKQQCQKYKSIFQESHKEVGIIRFEAPQNASSDLTARYNAAKISAEQKVSIFDAIGVAPKYIVLGANTAVEEFEQIIQSLNEDDKVIAAIVQYPILAKFTSSVQLLESHKDIDIVRRQSNNFFQSCATAEGIKRIVESYAQEDSNVAVVGGDGFVGSGVIKYLESSEIKCFCLEDGDDLRRTIEADIVVSVTGRQGLLTPYVLPSHRLIVDGGFTPTVNGAVGDVERSVYDIPQNITPVPGGIGPIEMAVLAERLIKMDLGIELRKWNYQELRTEQMQCAATIVPIARKLFGQQAITSPQSIQVEKENVFVLSVDAYKLSYNRTTQSFTVGRSNENLTLIRLDIGTNRIETARGITTEDITRWEQLQTIIDSRTTQSTDREIEL